MRLTEEQLAAHQKRVKPPRTPLTTEIEGLQKAYASAKPKKAPALRQLRESIQDIEKVFQGMKAKPLARFKTGLTDIEKAIIDNKATTLRQNSHKRSRKASGRIPTPKTPKKPVIRIPTEHEEQAAVIKWWAGYAAQHKIPENLLFAIPNGANKSMATAAKFKREGLRKGVPDLFLAVPRGVHGLFLEMKRTVKAQVSDDQYYFAEGLRDQGYRVVFCFGAENAIRVIKEYLDVE